MAVARGSRLGRTPSAGSATITRISGPRPWRSASASASPANAPPPITMLGCADMLRTLRLTSSDYTCYIILAGPNRAAKQGPNLPCVAHPANDNNWCHRRTTNRKRLNVQRTDRPHLDPRSGADRGELVPRQQPEDELAAGVRRSGDRTGDGGCLPHG